VRSSPRAERDKVVRRTNRAIDMALLTFATTVADACPNDGAMLEEVCNVVDQARQQLGARFQNVSHQPVAAHDPSRTAAPMPARFDHDSQAKAHAALTRQRVRAIDKALGAMIAVIRAELPGNFSMLEGFKALASRTRQQLLARFPNTSDELGRDA
jgi:hypothetical protein